MALPPINPAPVPLAYARLYDFLTWEAANPNKPLPGVRIQSEFDALGVFAAATRASLASQAGTFQAQAAFMQQQELKFNQHDITLAANAVQLTVQGNAISAHGVTLGQHTASLASQNTAIGANASAISTAQQNITAQAVTLGQHTAALVAQAQAIVQNATAVQAVQASATSANSAAANAVASANAAAAASVAVNAVVAALTARIEALEAAAGGGGSSPQLPLIEAAGTPSYTVGAADGSVIASLSPLPAISGITRTFAPADGRVVVSGGGDLVKGLTAIAASFSGTVTDSAPGYLPRSFPVTIGYVAAAGAPAITTYRIADFERPTIPTTPVAGVSFAPIMMEPDGLGSELVGLAFTSPTDAALAARYVTRQHGFAPGMLQTTDTLDVRWESGGTASLTQMDVKATHPDGSVRLANLTCLVPAIAQNSTLRGVVRKGAAALGGAPIALTSGGAGQFTASFTVVSRVPYADAGDGVPVPVNITTDISPATLIAAAGGTFDYWIRGPLAAQARFVLRLTDAVSVTLDHTQYADGTVEDDWHFAADGQMGWTHASNPTSWRVNVSISQGGTPVYALTDYRLWQSKAFDRRVFSGHAAAINALAKPREHGLQVDITRLIHWNFLPANGQMYGIADTRRAAFEGIVDQAGFRGPDDHAGLQLDNMGGPGARPDIGFYTGMQQAYLQCGTHRMWQVVMAQAEAIGRVKINEWDLARNKPLNIFPTIGRPNAWADARKTDFVAAGWHPPDGNALGNWDGAHQPAFAHLAYLLTGRRRFHDAIITQANAAILQCWDHPRRRTAAGTFDGVDWIIFAGNQIREWNIRDVAETLHLLPDGDTFKTPFADLLAYNMAYANAARVNWAKRQGRIAGWVPDTGGGNRPNENGLKFWMQDNFAATLYSAWRAGVPGVYEYFATFFGNAISGRVIFPGSQPSLYKRSAWFVHNVDWPNTTALMTPNTYPGLYSDAAFGPDKVAERAAAAGPPLNEDGWEGFNQNQLMARSLYIEKMILKNQRASDALALVVPFAPNTSVAAYRTDGNFTETLSSPALTSNAVPLAAPGQMGTATITGTTSTSITATVPEPTTGGVVGLRLFRTKIGANPYSDPKPFASSGGFQATGLPADTSVLVEYWANNAQGDGPINSFTQATGAGVVTPPAGPYVAGFAAAGTTRGVWGLRQMVTGYTGALLRIQPQGGGTEVDIGQVNSVLDATAAAAVIGAGAYAQVTRIYRQDGSGLWYAPTENTNPDKPRLHLASGGVPAHIRPMYGFTTGADAIDLAAGSDVWVHMVALMTNGVGGDTRFFSILKASEGFDDEQSGFAATASGYLLKGGLRGEFPTIGQDVFHVLQGTYEGATSIGTAYLNGTAGTPQGQSPASRATGPAPIIWGRNGNGNHSAFDNIWFTEGAIGTNLSERAALRTAAKATYSVLP